MLALGEHVDYWDSLGWRDPFSSHEFTLRQERYAAQFGSDRIYTPQAVVGGQLDVAGSDEPRLRRALEGFRSQARGTMVLRQAAGESGALTVHIDVEALPAHGGADVMVAVVEDGLVSKVTAGENGGRTLEHAAVVRKLTRIGEARGAAWMGDQRITVDSTWAQERRAPRRFRAGAQHGSGPRRRRCRNRCPGHNRICAAGVLNSGTPNQGEHVTGKMMKGAMIAGALCTILASGAAFAGKDAKHVGAVKCEGANDCKGKGSCKGSSNDCKGQNGCKGQGFTETKDAKACEAQGGKVASADTTEKG